MLNWCGYVLGNLWRKLGYFLLQNMVTLLDGHMFAICQICLLESGVSQVRQTHQLFKLIILLLDASLQMTLYTGRGGGQMVIMFAFWTPALTLMDFTGVTNGHGPSPQ